MAEEPVTNRKLDQASGGLFSVKDGIVPRSRPRRVCLIVYPAPDCGALKFSTALSLCD